VLDDRPFSLHNLFQIFMIFDLNLHTTDNYSAVTQAAMAMQVSASVDSVRKDWLSMA